LDRYLIDTNVISEFSKKKSRERIQTWFASLSLDDIYISVISEGEILYGIAKLPNDKHKERIQGWFKVFMAEWFPGGGLAIDDKVVQAWATLRAASRTLPVLDSLLAATALAHDMVLVTRNTRDFTDISGLKVINPFV